MKVRVVRLVKSYKELEIKMEQLLNRKETSTEGKDVQTTPIISFPTESDKSIKLEKGTEIIESSQTNETVVDFDQNDYLDQSSGNLNLFQLQNQMKGMFNFPNKHKRSRTN